MILCCGEALIDMVPIKDASGQEGFAPLPGGAIFNTAISLGRLGQSVGFFSGLSSDLFGDALRDMLTASKVDSSLAHQSDQPTTLAFVRLNDGHATYTFYDENTAGRMLAETDLPSVPGDVSCLYFGGISLCSEPAADAYRAFTERESKGRVIMIDPNIRAGFIKDEPAYRARLERMIRVSDVVKVSDEDLDWIIPGNEDHETKARALLSQGPEVVIITLGKEGAIALSKAGTRAHAPANLVEVVDTVGAGDTFNAGVLASFQEQGCLSKAAIPTLSADVLTAALTLGAKVAAVTVSRAGANPPWRDELSD